MLAMLCALVNAMGAPTLTWNSAEKQLRLADSESLNGLSIVENGTTLIVTLGAGHFSANSAIAGVIYNQTTPSASSTATIATGGACQLATLAIPALRVDQPIELVAGTISIETGPRGIFTLDANGTLVSGGGDIAIAADSMTLDGFIATTNGVVTLAPASPGAYLEVGDQLVPTILGISHDEIQRITAASLILGSPQCGSIYLTGPVAPRTAKLALQTADDIVEFGGIILVGQLDLWAKTVSLNQTNQVDETTLWRGYLSLDSLAGPSLSGHLNIGTPGDSSYAKACWFANEQLGAGAKLALYGAAIADINGHTQSASNLHIEGGTLSTENGALRLHGDLQRVNPDHNTATLSGNVDLNGDARVFDIDGSEDFIDLNGDLWIAANLRNGGFVKTGPGTLVLSGLSKLEKTCAVAQGNLLIDGILEASVDLNPADKTIEKNIFLSGSGIVGSVHAKRDCAVVPGDISGARMGALLLNGGVSTFAAGSALAFFIKGAESSLLWHTNSGIIDLSGEPDLLLLPYSPVIGRIYELISTPGGQILGHFNTLPEGTVFQDAYGWGRYFQIHYSDTAVTLKSGYPTDTLLTVTPETAAYGEPVTFQATVSHPELKNPTGMVAFTDNGTLIGSAPLEGNLATFTISTLNAGTHEIIALYGGDAYFLASNSTTNRGAAGLPVITKQPVPYAGVIDGSAQFEVAAQGYAPMRYQWRWNNQPLTGATNASLFLNRLTSAHIGGYDVIVGNAYGSVTSQVARLSVSRFFAFGDSRYGLSTVPPEYFAPVSIALGWLHNVALLNDGTVRTWGNNYYQQLEMPGGLTNIVAVSAGAYHSLALDANGVVSAWGLNWLYQTNVPEGLSNVVAISAGSFHNLALKTDGTVAAWGYDYNGECAVPEGLSNVVAVAAGTFHSLALKSDGTVVAWGENSLGQGDVPAGLTNVTAIAAGAYHSMAVLVDGTVVGWGDNRYEQLRQPAGLRQVVAIACGDSHTLALKSDGTVVAWGHNQYSQTAVLSGIHDAVAIAAGGERSLVLGSR
jgi:hypothetical protein